MTHAEVQNPTIEKIRKLLKLASNNPSATEAAVAFGRAQELATRHQIELADLDPDDDPDDDMMMEEVEVEKRLPGWKNILVAGVSGVSGVYVVRVDGKITLVGREAAVQTVRYLYAAITSEVNRLAAANASGRGRKYATEYRLGATCAVLDRMEAQHELTLAYARGNGTSEAALQRVLGGQLAAETWFKSRAPGRYRRPKLRMKSTDAHAAGEADGQNINIGGNREVTKAPLALGPAS